MRSKKLRPSEEVRKDIDWILLGIDGNREVADEYERISKWLALFDEEPPETETNNG